MANMKPGAVAHPLGPIVYRVRARRPVRARLIGGIVFVGSMGILAAAAWITPDPSGMGSHRQLGLAPCTMVALTGLPCPTCGMTTAFAYTVRGQWLAAFGAQPAGFLLALLTVAATAVSLGVVVTGSVWTVNWYRVSPSRLVIALVLVVLAGWLYKLFSGVA